MRVVVDTNVFVSGIRILTPRQLVDEYLDKPRNVPWETDEDSDLRCCRLQPR